MPTTRDRVTLTINGAEFEHWSSIEISTSLDEFSTVKLVSPMDTTSREFRDAFRPFAFNPVQLKVNGETLFTGNMLDIEPFVSEEEQSVVATAYSVPANLNDCMMPAAALPLEFNGLSIRQILSEVLRPFNIEARFEGDFGGAFDKVALDVEETVLSFLVELAKQRNAVLSDTPSGELLCWRPVVTGKPVARLEYGPLSKIRPRFVAQSFFSEITGFTPARRRKRRGGRHTVLNPWLRTALRPFAFRVDDTSAGEATTAVRAKVARMFGNAAGYTVDDIPSWRTPSGELWRHNTTVTVLAPEAMIYHETELLIRSVHRIITSEETSAALELVMPGSFSGELPSSLPWGEP